MRRLVYSVLTGHAPLMTPLLGGLHGDRNLATTPARPFAVTTYDGPYPGISRVKQMRLTLWIHDEVGDYTLIEDLHKIARAHLEAQENVLLNGVRLLEARWEAESSDLFDVDRRTNLKTATYLLTGSGL